MAAPTAEANSKESASPNNTNSTRPESPKTSPAYWGYLFQDDKTPTKTLEALLRAVAKHIMTEIGDKRVHFLTPTKLAAFYRAVGGDYDSLFTGMDHQSISYIYRVTGCQHSLQPIPGNDFEPPSVPALTPRGFVRWESIEILLEPFPTELPKEAFPLEADTEVDKWHKACAEKLKKDATPQSDPATFKQPHHEHSSSGPERDEPKVKVAYAHFRNPYPEPSPRMRPAQPDYFNRPMPFSHVPSRAASQRIHTPHSPLNERHRPGSSSADERNRRRSFSDYPSPSHDPVHFRSNFPPGRPGAPPRRHSQAKHSSSDAPSDSDGGNASPDTKRRPQSHESMRPPPTIRRMGPKNSQIPPSPAVTATAQNLHPHRAETRTDETRKRTLPIPEVIRDKFDKVTSFLPGSRSPDRHRSTSGRRSEREREREVLAARRKRDQVARANGASRLSRSWSDQDSDESDAASDESAVERRRRQRLRENRDRERDEYQRDRERERERDRGRDRGREREWERQREREREDEREMRKRAPRYMPRPEAQRRTSSHADVDRMRDEIWDPRDREFRDDRKRWNERERAVSPMTGVGGRRYPAEPGWS
ncbi:hypothetical protein BN1708_007138 [Verticillium longisporum]|uniref:DUF7514 domain-containing protein n=1 Tax=Verticillium longisporum TaxID=100787 RepID=A0A0G4MR97_VERLO|nr:hypothetical protein BN1708_007138 [Verticillium longisporum]